MSAPTLCHSCGTALSSGRLRGLCPRCLMRGMAVAPQEARLQQDMTFAIPGHENLRELARGGMGIVYQARQLAPEREVAVKMLLPQTITEEMRERFRLEARTMADLNHPGILPLHQFGEWAGVPFFTMKLASGGTLSSRQATYAGKWREIAQLMAKVADAVAHAHNHGVLHRDLKPGNILFDEEDRAYVADFGLVKIANTDSNLTRSVAMLGTPQYLAPEIAASDARAATVRSDVFSLGAMLYELLAQAPAFRAENLPALLREIAETEPACLKKLGVPRDLATIASTCLAKDPLRRYESATALAADLRRWLEGKTITARPVSQAERLWMYARRHPAIAALSLLLVSAILVGAILQHLANVSLQQKTQTALSAQAQALRQSGQWDLRDAGLAAAHEAARLENSVDLRSDAITLLATPSIREAGRRPFRQSTWVPLTPDCQRYAEVTEGKLWLRSWDGPDAQEIPPPAGRSLLQAAYLSPDGRALLVRCDNDYYCIWQLQEQAWATGQYHGVWGLIFSPDGKRIAYGSMGGTEIKIEDWRSPAAQTSFSADYADPSPRAFSPDGRQLAVVTSQSGRVDIFDTTSGRRLHRLENPMFLKDHFAVVAWRPDSRALAVTTGVTDVLLWYLDGPTPFQRRLVGHAMEIYSVAWHPSGEYLATSGFDNTLRVWEVSSGHTGYIGEGVGDHLQFSQDGRSLLMRDSVRNELVRYEFTPSEVVRHVALPRRSADVAAQRGPWGVDLSPDGKFAVVGGSLGAYVLDATDGRRLATLNLGLVNAVNFSGNEAFWLCVPGVGLERCALTRAATGLWALSTPEMIYRTQGSLARLSESPATGVVACTLQNRLCLLPKGAKEEPADLPTPGVAVNPVAQSPDGRWVVCASCDQPEEMAYVWDVPARKLVQRLPETRACYMVFSPDSRTLYTVSLEGIIAWDVGTWQHRWMRPRVGPIQTHRFPAVSGNGDLLAVSRHSHGVDLFAPADGKFLATVDHPDARSIGWLALDYTGGRLAVNGNQHNIQLWDLRKLRMELAKLQLDWPTPPLPPPTALATERVISVNLLPSLQSVLQKMRQ